MMVPISKSQSQGLSQESNTSEYAMYLLNKFNIALSFKSVLKMYALFVFLIVLPPLVIRSGTLYQLAGELATSFWSLAGALALFYTARNTRQISKRLSVAWFIMALSGIFSALGNMLWLLLTQVFGLDPYPSIADYFYLLSYPLILLGVLSFPYLKNGKTENIKIALETITVVVSMGLFVWFFVLHPIFLQSAPATSLERLVTLSYFLVDTLLFLAIWVLVALKSTVLNIQVKFQMGLSLVFLIFADTFFLVQDLQGLYFETVRVTDIAYNLSSLLLGMAGLTQVFYVPGQSQTPVKENYWLANTHRFFADTLLFISFFIFIAGYGNDQIISFNAIAFWVGFLILISISLQRLDGHDIYALNEELKKFNNELENRVQERTSELIVVNTKLEQAGRIKDEFMAAISHELRTPLISIVAGADTLRSSASDTLSEKQIKSIDMIDKGGQKLLALINDLIDYSRLQSGLFSISKERCNLNDICRSSLHSIESMSDAKKQHITFNSFDSNLFIYTDAQLLKKMLRQILTNASKFTPNEGEFGISIMGEHTSYVELVVWDKGIGMNQADLQKIFTPFVQLDSSLARRYEGTGLGLALVVKILDLLNGRIAVKSIVGQGSQFIIHLPVHMEL